MSVEELKAVVDGATVEERRFLAAYIRLKNDDGNLPVALGEARKRMEAGQGVSWEKVVELQEREEK